MHEARVLYIHGAGPHPPADELRRQIDAILFPGDADPPTDIAWYADVTDAAHAEEEAAARARARQTETVAAPGEAAQDDDHGLDDRLMRGARRLWMETVGLASGSGGGSGLLLRLAAAMGSVDEREPDEGRRESRSEALWHFYRDVSGYLENDSEIAPVLRERVRDAIVRNPDPLLIIAHSLGTVIAFDVLAEAALAERRVALVTVGSPLGLGPLQDRLAAWAGVRPVAVPRGVTRWRNFHAHGDPVAVGSDLDNLHNDFQPRTVIHSTLVRNEAGFHHSFLGYLETPEVQDAIYATLGLRRAQG